MHCACAVRARELTRLRIPPRRSTPLESRWRDRRVAQPSPPLAATFLTQPLAAICGWLLATLSPARMHTQFITGRSRRLRRGFGLLFLHLPPLSLLRNWRQQQRWRRGRWWRRRRRRRRRQGLSLGLGWLLGQPTRPRVGAAQVPERTARQEGAVSRSGQPVQRDVPVVLLRLSSSRNDHLYRFRHDSMLTAARERDQLFAVVVFCCQLGLIVMGLPPRWYTKSKERESESCPASRGY